MHAEKLIVMLNCSPCVVDTMTHNESFYLELKLVKKQLFVTLGPWGTVTRGLRPLVTVPQGHSKLLFNLFQLSVKTFIVRHIIHTARGNSCA